MSKGSLKPQSSVADSLHQGLRAPRRTGQSYDYLAPHSRNEEEALRRKQRAGSGDFDYHNSGASPHNAPSGKRREYTHADQNRHQHRHQHVPTNGKNAVDRYSTESESQVMVFNSMHHHPDNGDIDSSEEDEIWVAEELAKLLPDIINPPDESRVAARVANPGPLGLLGFGLTTVLLNLHNCGYHPLFTAIPAMGIVYGGGCQFIAGLLEFSRGNTFGCVAFCGYGAFWLSLVCVWMLPNASIGGPAIIIASSQYMVGAYLVIWGILSFFLLICTIRMNCGIFLVLLSVVLLFLLGGGNMAANVDAVKAAGYEGCCCGIFAMYVGIAEVVNEVFDQTILPVIPMPQLLGWLGYGPDGKKKNTNDDQDGTAQIASSSEKKHKGERKK